MTNIPFFAVLFTLWRMLSPPRRLVFCLLVVGLFVASVLDMGSILMILGFIGGLRVNENGERGGRFMLLINLFVDGPLTDREYIVIVGSTLMVVMLIKNFLSTSVQFALNRFLMKLNQRVSVGLFKGYLVAPYEEIIRAGASGPTGKITRIFEVFSSCFQALAHVLVDGTLVLIVAAVLFYIQPWLTVGTLVVFGSAGIALYWFMQKTLVQMGREDQVHRKEANGYLSDGMQGLAETRLRDARPHLIRGYERALSKTAVMRRRIIALKRLPKSSNEMLLVFLLVGSVHFLMASGVPVQDALPTLALFGYTGLRLTSAFNRLNGAFQNLRRNAEEFQAFHAAVVQVAPHVFETKLEETQSTYLDEEVPLPPGKDGRLHVALTAKNLWFRYPKARRDTIRGLSLTIPKGKMVSFCGPSGGGKTTLVLLLLGLLRPRKGTLQCDDWSIYQHIRAWHKNVGYVGQQMYFSRRSIKENIAFGIPPWKIDVDKVWNALRLARADDFVRALPNGIEQQIREGGGNLSGGQRQRLIIARALYDDPDIVVFDEATAALDNVTEREITDAIFTLSGTKTVICIAHRLSSIQHSDTIYVVEEGRISGCGTFDELLGSNETFRKLASALEGDPNDVTG